MTSGPYRTFYNDASKDPYNGTYVDILNEYNTGANQPQALRNKVYTSGNAGRRPMSHLILTRDPQQAGDGPGKIVAYHRATRHDAIIGLTTPFDGIGYAFLGESHGNQPPLSVVLSDDLFNSVNATQVPTLARMDQLLAADPALELVGPYQATDANVEPVTVRRIIYVPPKYMLMAMETALTPRQAWTQIKGAIVADGATTDCQELLNWLRVALTRRAAGEQPRITVPPPASPQLMDPQHVATFQNYRLGILHADIPQLSPSHVTAGAQAIATNIAELATETRLTREEGKARRVQDANKSPSDLYGPSLTRLLRIAQVAAETALQPIHTALAKAKKERRRATLQAAIDTTIEDLGYNQDLPLTASLVNKILNLEYYSSLEDDFSVGLNIFCMGQLEPESIEEQRRFITQTDAILGSDASASLSDVITLLNPSGDVCIPRTLPQLRDNIEKYHALMLTLLGSTHQLVIETKSFRDALIARERKLERAQPRNPVHRYIVPALIGRRGSEFWNSRLILIGGDEIFSPSVGFRSMIWYLFAWFAQKNRNRWKKKENRQWRKSFKSRRLICRQFYIPKPSKTASAHSNGRVQKVVERKLDRYRRGYQKGLVSSIEWCKR